MLRARKLHCLWVMIPGVLPAHLRSTVCVSEPACLRKTFRVPALRSHLLRALLRGTAPCSGFSTSSSQLHYFSEYIPLLAGPLGDHQGQRAGHHAAAQLGVGRAGSACAKGS